MKTFLTILCVLLASELHAEEEIIDTRGKDFWLAFPPNYHTRSTKDEPEFRFGDSLMIFISAETTAQGIISYTDVYGNRDTTEFEILSPNEVYSFQITFYYHEIPGFNSKRDFGDDSDFEFDLLNYNEQVSDMAFHVESDKDVRVYANSQAEYTSEAMLVYPTKSLGEKYMVMSYPSDLDYDAEMISKSSSTPSQFVIVSTEDSTEVLIRPSDHTIAHGKNEFTITLQKGETYLVQADVLNYDRSDLTGTEIISNRPFAVISGHQRAPIKIDNRRGCSRDILIEQMPPLKVWGTRSFFIPFPEMPSHPFLLQDDIFRVVAFYDNTKISLNNSETVLLNKGEYYEGVLDKVYVVQGNKPILSAQFKKSSTLYQSFYDGDPFMMIIPTAELYLNNYTFTNIQAYEPVDKTLYEKVYKVQYVTVVIQRDFISTLILDGAPVNGNLFKDIPHSDYAYAHIENIGDGTHTISAQSNFGIYVYGIGPANSYGYVGGMNLDPIDFNPPKINKEILCDKITGFVTDTAGIDSKIGEVRVEKDVNATVDIEDFQKYAPVVGFTAFPTDPYNDAKFTIVAVDSIGLENESLITIPGFTVGGVDESNNVGFAVIKDIISVEKGAVCYYVDIKNYGSFTQKITDAYLTNGGFDIELTPKEFTLAPGESATVEICVDTDTEGFVSDTVVFGNECISRSMVILEIEGYMDPGSPDYSLSKDDCNSIFDYTIVENRNGDIGIETVEIIEEINCVVEIGEFDILNMKTRVNVLDPYNDAFYTINATDSLGKITVIRDSVPGFTVVFSSVGASQEHSIENTAIGETKCEEVMLQNFGIFDITLDESHFAINHQFTVPISQFPLTIPSGEEVPLEVCFYPNIASEELYRDSLDLFYNCVGIRMPFKAKADSLRRQSDSRCEIKLQMVSGKMDYGYSISEPFPNPAENTVSIKFSTPQADNIELGLYTLEGKNVLEHHERITARGNYEINLDVADISSGSYMIVVSLGDKRDVKTVHINK